MNFSHFAFFSVKGMLSASHRLMALGSSCSSALLSSAALPKSLMSSLAAVTKRSRAAAISATMSTSRTTLRSHSLLLTSPVVVAAHQRGISFGGARTPAGSAPSLDDSIEKAFGAQVAAKEAEAAAAAVAQDSHNKIKEFKAMTSSSKLSRARANPKDKMHRMSRWLLFFEGWTVIFWLGLGGYIAYRLMTADDESVTDTINTAWRNATEFTFDRSKLKLPADVAAAAEAKANAEAASVLYVLEKDDTTSLVQPEGKGKKARATNV